MYDGEWAPATRSCLGMRSLCFLSRISEWAALNDDTTSIHCHAVLCPNTTIPSNIEPNKSKRLKFCFLSTRKTLWNKYFFLLISFFLSNTGPAKKIFRHIKMQISAQAHEQSDLWKRYPIPLWVVLRGHLGISSDEAWGQSNNIWKIIPSHSDLLGVLYCSFWLLYLSLLYCGLQFVMQDVDFIRRWPWLLCWLIQDIKPETSIRAVKW